MGRIEEKRKYAGEKKASMKRRDDGHDYTERRMYMITIEVEGRRPLFGRLKGNPLAQDGSGDEPDIELTALGKAVRDEWLGIPRYFPQIEVMAVQMMPDHLHGILFVKERLPVHLGQVISGFKAGCRKAQRALAAGEAAAGEAAAEPLRTEKGAAAEPPRTEKEPLRTEKGAAAEPPRTEKEPLRTEKGAAAEPPRTEKEPPRTEKGAATEPPRTEKEPPRTEEGARSLQAAAAPLQLPTLFAKGYNDLILRSYDELPAWCNYLRDNPRRLLLRRACPQWLRPVFGITIGAYTCSAIGNRGLLSAERRVQVRVSRRLVGEALDREVERFLALARSGAVLVSPAISPGEKRIMRSAFDEKLPVIVIVENGFTPMSKPHGEQFYACGEGRLLILSPWEHHNEKRKVTAQQCGDMNLLAWEVCR